MKKILRIVLVVLIAAFVAAQFVRPDRSNPPIDETKVLQAPADVQAILDRSCADCHSSNTRWPWYTNVAPISWMIADHVEEGRKELSFSEFGTYAPKKAAKKMQEVCEQVEQGEMPMQNYVLLHRDAKLSDADKARLCEWSKVERARIQGGGAGAAEAAPAPAPESSEREEHNEH